MSMDFRHRISSLMDRVEGARGAALVDLDGIPIESQVTGLDIVSIVAECTPFLRDAQRAAQDLQLGTTQAIYLLGGEINLLFRFMKSEWLLALATGDRGNWGKARYWLEAEAQRLEPQL